tara:strand:+ start:45 stop:1259 length:1215 start_codon:yes stop_codon:yes gene_type:complete
MKLNFKKKFTLNDLKIFRKSSKDNNTLHYSKKINNITPYKKPVVYAALLIQFILKKTKISSKSIEEINAMFFKPVLLGENIIFEINNFQNRSSIIISNGIINKASIIIDYEKNKIEKKNKIYSNLYFISKNIGNFRNNLNIISYINIKKKIRNNKTKKYYLKKIENNFIAKLNFKNYENKVNFSSYITKRIQKEHTALLKTKLNYDYKSRKNKGDILIIGGSSGLGSVLSQFFLSKDIKHTFTFNNKKKIKNLKCINKVNSFQFNNKSSQKKFQNLKNFEIIYFFPTPKIFSFSNEPFDIKKYNRFNEIYINFFYKIIRTLLASKKKHKIFVPSTNLIDNPTDSIEYALSKKSMEFFMNIFNKNCKNLKLYYPRFDAYFTNNTRFFLNINKNYDNFIKAAIEIL